jgi:hypothetical protein
MYIFYLFMRLYKSFWSRFYRYLRMGTKRKAGNARWILMFVLSRFRFFHSPITSSSKNSSYEPEESIFQEVNIDNAVKDLKKDGIHLGIRLPPDYVSELLKHVDHSICYGNRNYEFGFPYRHKTEAEEKYGQSFVRADYCNDVLNCPTVWKIAHDPKLREIAFEYLGGKPLYTGSLLWWLFAKKEEEKTLLMKKMTFLSLRKMSREGSYFFHYDLDDYRCLRFFFYLTEVDFSSGPHCCVQGSHERKKMSHLFSPSRRCSERDILDFYGTENVITICGEPGFGFVEDTFCFHKAAIPCEKDRLVLMIQFTLNDYRNV